MIPKYQFFPLLIILFFFGCKQSDSKMSNTDPWQLVWSDEFEYEGLPDPSKWAFEVGDGCPELCGWGNNEFQYYTKDSLKNARVTDGHLIIEVHNELINDREFSSAKLVTKGIQDWK